VTAAMNLWKGGGLTNHTYAQLEPPDAGSPNASRGSAGQAAAAPTGRGACPVADRLCPEWLVRLGPRAQNVWKYFCREVLLSEWWTEFASLVATSSSPSINFSICP